VGPRPYNRPVPGGSGLHYDEWVAQFYDTWFSDWLDSAGTVERLVELAGPGPVLELGIGTGRVALPLRERGVDVHGIDASPAMVARLRAKPGGDAIPVTIGDFTEVSLAPRFSLVYVTAGSFFELQSQEAQLRCFQSVAGHLVPGGLFVLDGLVPDESQQAMKVIPSRSSQLVLRVRDVDRVAQRYVSYYLVVADHGTRFFSVPFRYAWPSELDLMARFAGLRLRERTAGWKGEPFIASSASHVSVYEAPPPDGSMTS
jgi:SAM-dependent methyltransferase